MKIVVCLPQVPFVRGGAEVLADGLVGALRSRGHDTALVTVPYRWIPDVDLLENVVLWRTVHEGWRSDPPDLVIGTKFPSYVVSHPNKVVWLIHQFRQAYDLHGTPFAQFRDDPHGAAMRQAVRTVDDRALSEAAAVFTISRNTADRLALDNDVRAEVLYPPPQNLGLSWLGDDGYVLSVGRLDRTKRTELLIHAACVVPGLRVVIVGQGEERPVLERLADSLGVGDRITFTGGVDPATLAELYGRCRAVYYAPLDEDLGMVAVEAHLAGKAVVTTTDAGGPLEFVSHEGTGLVAEPELESIAAALSRLDSDAALAARLGAAGTARARELTWDRVVDRLLEAGA